MNNKFKHPNIVYFLELYEWDEKLESKTNYYFAVILPKVKYSLQKIIDENINFDRKIYSQKMIKQIISAMYFLHTEFRINHGNIKPNNILIDDMNNFILTDFDDSKFIK